MISIRTSYQGKANGMICLHQYDSPRHWTQDEIRLLKAVAAQMGIAIAQANLLEQDKQQRLKLQRQRS
jgi:GAF domain-containing protein